MEDLLSLEQISKILSEECVIDNPSSTIAEGELSKVKEKIDPNPPSEIEMGQCLLNACITSQITGSQIIEGIVYLQVKSNDDNVHYKTIRHVWNRKNDINFDITDKLVWSNFAHEIQKKQYYTVGVYEFKDYNMQSGKPDFLSNAPQVALSVNYLYTQESVTQSLHLFGLRKEYQLKILHDLITNLQ